MSELERLASGVANSRGQAALMFAMPRVPADTAGAIGAAFVYLHSPTDGGWTFSALPRDLVVQQYGTTREDPPRERWRAAVPSATGAARYYCSSSQDGPWSPYLPGRSRFETLSGGGYVEHATVSVAGDGVVRAAGAIVHQSTYFASNMQIERAEAGQHVHTYTHGQGQVTIEANTTPASRMRIDLDSSDRPETVVVEINRIGLGWLTVWQAVIQWSNSDISQIALAPRGVTYSFRYHGEGTLAEIDDCSGRTWSLSYEEVT